MFDLEEVLLGVQPAENRQLAALPEALQQVSFAEAAIDSREVVADALFVALVGERVDGHTYLPDVAARGAKGALVQRERVASLQLDSRFAVIAPDGTGFAHATPEQVLLVAVDDPLAALQRLAAYHRELFAPITIGITGSVGKTSTKEITASVLQRRYRTLKNPRSYNSESTLPLGLLQLTAEHDVAVLEMGTYGPGDIALLARLARPQIGIMTNIGPSHLERMGTLDVVAAAKSELLEALPADGHAILNYDDLRVRAAAAKTVAKPFFYGLDPAADIWADQIESHGLQGISFRAHHAGEAVTLRLPLLGRHSVHTALAATAAGLILGLGWDAIIDGLRDEKAQLRLLAVPAFNNATLIDDTYNASPVSSLAALNLLADLEGRRIAVLGDMLELGSYEEEAHRIVGRRAAEVVDQLITVGQRAQWIADEARASGLPAAHIQSATSNTEVVAMLRELLQPNDYALIKASRGAAMESVVAALQRQTSSLT